MKSIALVLLTITISHYSIGQSQMYSKVPMGDEKLESQKMMLLANEMYKFGDIKEAAGVYEVAFQFDSNNYEAVYWAGKSYLESNRKLKSITFLKKVYSVNPKYKSDICFLLGKSYQLNKEPLKAIDMFLSYQNQLKSDFESKEISKKVYISKIGETIEKIALCN